MGKNENSLIYQKNNSLLLTSNDEIFPVELYDSDKEIFNPKVAYLQDDYYFVYRGEASAKDIEKSSKLKPGIYTYENNTILIYPRNAEEEDEYSYKDKIVTIDPNKIVEAINRKETVFAPIPEGASGFLPSIDPSDDILKRLMKQVIIKKNIDIDQCKDRFLDRNSLFNYKSAIRGTNKISMLLFDRGCEAFNLKYKITLEEIDPDNFMGDKLDEPISASSEDTFVI